MDANIRAELLRQRLRAIRPLAVAPRVQAQKKPAEHRGPAAGRMSHASLGFALSWKWGRTDWVQESDAKPENTPKPKRNAGDVATLTKIAKKAPSKLKRRFLIAEEMLPQHC